MTGEQNGTSKYSKSKKSAIEWFLAILSGHKVLHILTEMVPHPNITNQIILRLLRDLSGSKTDAKKKILNSCLLVFMMNFCKKTLLKEHSIDEINADTDLLVDSLYQLNTTETEFKYIFAYLHEHGVPYKLGDFQGEGMSISYPLLSEIRCFHIYSYLFSVC